MGNNYCSKPDRSLLEPKAPINYRKFAIPSKHVLTGKRKLNLRLLSIFTAKYTSINVLNIKIFYTFTNKTLRS